MPTDWLPYPNEDGISSIPLPPSLNKGIPSCQPCITFASGKVAPKGLDWSNMVQSVSLPTYTTVTEEFKLGGDPFPWLSIT